MTRDQLLQDMKNCWQTEGQSVYEHGVSVWQHALQVIDFLDSGRPPEGWRLPGWATEYREDLRRALLPLDVIEEYAVYHDCGKPYCEPDGIHRFPNHAEVSYRTWLSVGGREAAANLMRLDMRVHTLKSAEVSDFAKLPEAATLLIVGLAEVHSNAAMFGGVESESFKIKWKHLDRRGRAICKAMFPKEPTSKLYLVTRNDLPAGQQAIQAAHALREFSEHHPEEDRKWYKTSNTLAMLAVPDEPALEALLEGAQGLVPVAPFWEPDRDNELTAIALGPQGRRLCANLPLALKAP